jgi:hypothetical protein
MKRPNIIPSQQLNVALPLPLYTQLSAHLYSELECRVPHGAFSRFLIELLRARFSEESLDLAPWVGSAPGAMVVTGQPATLGALRQLLSMEVV